jgi:uncharacterized protein (DUF983 family)
MESKPKRARKICPTCNEELSYHHFLRHIEDCKTSTSSNDLHIFPDEIADKCEKVYMFLVITIVTQQLIIVIIN